MVEAPLRRKKGSPPLLYSLINIELIIGDGWNHLTEVTKDCRSICDMFNIGPPKRYHGSWRIASEWDQSHSYDVTQRPENSESEHLFRKPLLVKRPHFVSVDKRYSSFTYILFEHGIVPLSLPIKGTNRSFYQIGISTLVVLIIRVCIPSSQSIAPYNNRIGNCSIHNLDGI